MTKKLIRFIDKHLSNEKDLYLLESVMDYYIKESNSNYIKFEFERLGNMELQHIIRKYNKLFHKCYTSNENEFFVIHLFKISPMTDFNNTLNHLVLNSDNITGNNFTIKFNCPKDYFLSLSYNFTENDGIFNIADNNVKINFV